VTGRPLDAVKRCATFRRQSDEGGPHCVGAPPLTCQTDLAQPPTDYGIDRRIVHLTEGSFQPTTLRRADEKRTVRPQSGRGHPFLDQPAAAG
jgi:hypothetical protein